MIISHLALTTSCSLSFYIYFAMYGQSEWSGMNFQSGWNKNFWRWIGWDYVKTVNKLIFDTDYISRLQAIQNVTLRRGEGLRRARRSFHRILSFVASFRWWFARFSVAFFVLPGIRNLLFCKFNKDVKVTKGAQRFGRRRFEPGRNRSDNRNIKVKHEIMKWKK